MTVTVHRCDDPVDLARFSDAYARVVERLATATTTDREALPYAG